MPEGNTYCEMARAISEKICEIFAEIEIKEPPESKQLLVYRKDLIKVELQEIQNRIIAIFEKPCMEEGEYTKVVSEPFNKGSKEVNVAYEAEMRVECKVENTVLEIEISKSVTKEKQIL